MNVDKRAFDTLTQKVAGLERQLTLLSRAPVRVPTCSINDLPKAVDPGLVIFVPDASGGAVLAVSDGNGWLELQPVGAIS